MFCHLWYTVLSLVTQWCLTLCDHTHYIARQAPLSLGILQARILECIAIPSSRGIFPTQGRSNPDLLHCRWIVYHLSLKGSPQILEWVAYPSSREFSWPRNFPDPGIEPGSLRIEHEFFTSWEPGRPSSCISVVSNTNSPFPLSPSTQPLTTTGPLWFFFFNWRLITLQYFCHTFTWISHGCTCVPHPDHPTPSYLSGSSHCTSPECPASCIKPGLAICFTYENIHGSMLFSQIIPPLPFPTESNSLFFTSVSLSLSHI